MPQSQSREEMPSKLRIQMQGCAEPAVHMQAGRAAHVDIQATDAGRAGHEPEQGDPGPGALRQPGPAAAGRLVKEDI